MFRRIAVIALNTYREAVRARILHGLFGLALATLGYALVVAAFALRETLRVVSDLGAASISIYSILVAIVLGATSLYRELELKTIFPILARPLRRSEYLIGKYLGTLLTLTVFVAANSGVLLLAVGELSGRALSVVTATGLGSVLVAGLVAWRVKRWRTFVPILWAFSVLGLGWFLAAGARDERQLLVGSGFLVLCEVGIVIAIATVFAAFSSPFLTALFTTGVLIVGRSADTLAHLPVRVFGQTIQHMAQVLSRIVPNLMLYVPPRPLLTGEAAGQPLGTYLLWAAGHTTAWCVVLLALASLIFKRRDFL
ncbi:MAG TPA: ABC transporter permease subunit [Polyangiaceae bacterium]|jgi:hypothetical protein